MAELDDPRFAELNTLVRAAMHQTQTPGVALGIVHGNKRWLASWGVTNVENPLEVTPSTLFQIGSITKTFTALALAILEDEAKVDLEAPVRAYLPDFAVLDEQASATVNVRHLITHTSGWVGDFFRDTGQGEDALARYVASLKNVPQLFAPGALWSYNNAAFAVAGRVVEVVSGIPVEEFLTQRILRSLGMTSSCIFARDVVAQRVVSGHFWGGDRGPFVAHPWWKTRATSAVGSIVSSAEEMVRYLRFQMAETGVSEEGKVLLSAERLQTSHHILELAEPGFATGYAWQIELENSSRVIRHGGATVGQMALSTLALSKKFGFIVLTNGQRGDRVCEAIATWLRRDFAIENHDNGIPEEARKPSVQVLSAYAGYYRAKLTHVRLTVAQGGLLVEILPQGGYPLEESPPAPPSPTAFATQWRDDVFHVGAPPGDSVRDGFAPADFLRDESGNIIAVRIGGRVHLRDR